MPSLDRDKYRKVSQPTQADFARGIANSAAKGNKAGLVSLAGFLVLSKFLRRGK